MFFPLSKKDTRFGMLVMSGSEEKLYNVDEGLVVTFCQNLMNLVERNSLQSELHQDPLTRVANRRYFDARWRKEFSQAIQQKSQLSLLLIDIDFFKKINDQYGHTKGDEALKVVGQVISNNIRPTDVVARWGGEEFVVILPETSPNEAAVAAERIRQKIEASDWAKCGFSEPVTVSLGIGSYPQHGENQSEIYEAADRALYESKRSGRNRFTIGSVK
jgi:diguanylate cyclase (GGDEF)-like protein